MSKKRWICLADANPTIAIVGNPPNGTVGQPYSFQFTGAGGTPPYTFAVVGGSVPGGLNLAADGTLDTGSPTADGTFNFTVKVTDALGESTTAEFTINIAAANYTYDELIAADGAIFYYPLDEASGTTCFDAIGSADGTYASGNGGTLPRLGEAGLTTDGSTSVKFVRADQDYADMGDVHDPAGDFTWEIWFKSGGLPSVQTNLRIMDKRGTGSLGSTPGVFFGLRERTSTPFSAFGDIVVEDDLGNSVALGPVDASSYLDSTPHLLQLVWDDSTGTASFYCDNTLIDSGTNASMINSGANGHISTTRTFRLGGADNANTQNWNDHLAKAAGYDFAMDSTMRQAHYDKGTE